MLFYPIRFWEPSAVDKGYTMSVSNMKRTGTQWEIIQKDFI